MSENNKITQLDNIKKALEEDDFLLDASYFNVVLLFDEHKKKNNKIKETIKSNSNNDTEVEEICEMFELVGGNGIFKDLVEAERLKHMDTDEYNLVEKNGAGLKDSQVGQLHQAINPRRKLMTYTELTNTEAYDIVFKEIFDKAKEKINGNSNITVAKALKSSMEELIIEKQVEKSLEQLELEIVEKCDGLESDKKEQKINEIVKDFDNKKFEGYRKEIYENKKNKIENGKKKYELTKFLTGVSSIKKIDTSNIEEKVQKIFENFENLIKTSEYFAIKNYQISEEVKKIIIYKITIANGENLTIEHIKAINYLFNKYSVNKEYLKDKFLTIEILQNDENIKKLIEKEAIEQIKGEFEEKKNKLLKNGFQEIYDRLKQETIKKAITIDEIYNKKENKIKDRIDKFYKEAEKTVTENENKKYVEFSPRYKAAIMINQLNLNKLKKEHKYGKENIVSTNRMEKLKERLKRESDLREKMLKTSEATVDEMKTLEEKARFYSIKLCDAYERLFQAKSNKKEEDIRTIESEIKGYLDTINKNKDLKKEFQKLQLLKAIELEKSDDIKAAILEIENLNDIKYEDGRSLMEILAETDNVEIFKCFEDRIDINKEINGKSLASLLVENTSFDVLDYLINEKKLDINNFKTKDGENLFHVAARSASSKRMDILVDKFKGLDINATFGDDNKNVLDVARENGNGELEKYLIDKYKMESILVVKNEEEKREKEEIEQIKEYYKKQNEKIYEHCIGEIKSKIKNGSNLKNIIDYLKGTKSNKEFFDELSKIIPLKDIRLLQMKEDKYKNNSEIQVISKNNYFETGILDLGSNLEKLDTEAKNKLLDLIAKEGDKETLEFFRDKCGLDIKNVKDKNNLGLIHLAVKEGNKNLIEALIEICGSDIVNQTIKHTNQTPLMLATIGKNKDMYDFLISKGAKVDAKTIDDKTALYYAVKNNNIELVKTLIEKDSESINQTIEFPDKRKQSLFFIAVEKGNQEIIDLFLGQKDNLKIDFTETNEYGETLLHYLFNKKNMDLIDKLSGFEGFDINVKDEDGKTPLHYAVDTGLPVLVNGLTEIKGIDINVKDEDGKTPLHYAIKNNDAIITQSLFIKPEIDVNVKDKEGQSPLFTAVKNNNIELIKILTAREGIDPNIVDNYENSLLHYAVRKGNKEIVECLLNIKGIKIEKPSEDRPSPFLMAVRKKDNQEIIDLFLKRANELKIDFSEEDENEMSLLHYAAKNNNMELVKKLIDEKKFNPNITNGGKITPLYYAVANGNKEMVEYLLNIEDIKIIKPKNASNPFFKAMKVNNNNKDIIKLFLERADKLKIDFNEQNWDYGDSLLHYAIINKDEEIFNYLINREGIDVNIKNIYNHSPLDVAIQKNNKYAINLLIEKGAEIDFNRRIGNKNILHYAAENNNTDLMKKLIDKGGLDYINVKDTYGGKTPLHYAAENNNAELIKQLLDIDGIDLTIKDKSGRTAIDYMDRNIGSDMFIEEYQEIVEDLRERTEQQLKEKENKEKVENEDSKEINSKNSPSKDISSADDPNQQKNKDQIFEILENVTSYDDIIKKLNENNLELEDLKTLRNSDGKTLLHIAAENRNQDLVKDLIKKGGLDPNLKDNYSYTPLYYAIENNKNDTKDLEKNKEDIVKFLLGQSSISKETINQKLGSGSYKSLLSAAVLSGNVEIVKILIDKGADVNITNSLGQIPIFDAIAIGNKKMIDLLAERGADFNIKSNSGKTAFDYAEYYVKNNYINNEVINILQNAIKESISKTQNTDSKIRDKYPKPENTKKYAKDLEDVKLEQHKLENKLFNPLAIEGSDAELIKEKSRICNILMMRIRTAEKKLEKRKEELNELKEKIKKESETEEKQKLEEELKKRVEDFENRVELIKTREEILKTQKEELNLLIDGKTYDKEKSNNKYLEQQKKLKEVLSRVYAANRELGGQERSIY